MPCYVKDLPEGRLFVCGRLGPHCAECADVGEYLCDYPVGDGLTCDRPLCAGHAHEVGPDLHYCAAHSARWREFCDSGGERMAIASLVPLSGRVVPFPVPDPDGVDDV